MQAFTSRLSLVLVALTLISPASAFAQLTKAGVVTTLQGTATVTRASLSQPQPLKFRDDVFVHDRVVTGDDSVARILLGGTAIVTRSLPPAEAGALSNSFKAAKSEPPAAANASIVTQSQALAIKVMDDGIPNPGPSASGNGNLKRSIQTSIIPGYYDRRRDEAIQEVTRTQSGREALQDAQTSAQVLNSLSPSDRQQLNILIQQFRLSNSGPGSLNNGSGGGSSNSGPGNGTITLPSGLQVIIENGKPKSTNSGSGSTSSGSSGHH